MKPRTIPAATLTEVNCQEARSSVLHDGQGLKVGLAAEGDGPGPGVKVAQLLGCQPHHDFCMA